MNFTMHESSKVGLDPVTSSINRIVNSQANVSIKVTEKLNFRYENETKKKNIYIQQSEILTKLDNNKVKITPNKF